MATINQKPLSANKNAKWMKYVAVALMAVCIVALFLPMNYIVIGSGVELQSAMFVKVIGATFLSNLKALISFFFRSTGVLGLAAGVPVYGLMLALLFTFIFAVLALAFPKRTACFVKLAAFVLTWGFALYCLAVLIVSSYVNTVKATVDATTCTLAVLGALLYFAFLLKEYKKAAWVLAGQFVLSLLAVAFLFLAMTHNGHIVAEAVRSRATKLLLALSAIAALGSLALTTAFTAKLNKWTTILQLINTLAMLALALCVALLSRVVRMSNISYLFFSLLAAIVSFVQILWCVYQFYVASKTEDSALEALLAQRYEKEEYVEVSPYNGDASGAQVAQLADQNQAVAEEEIPDDKAKDALFEGKNDAFIATLSKAEKYEFADLFILKNKGVTSAIPVYEVGGENKAFFSKGFIYLSQYREKISSKLLAKIYEYAQN